MAMLQSKSSGLGARKTSPPQPTCMSSEQKATYLDNLRNNRPTRPTGSRPLPSKTLPKLVHEEDLPPRAGSALSFRPPNGQQPEGKALQKEHKLIHRASMPTSTSFESLGSQKGRPLVSSPYAATVSSQRRVSPPSTKFPDTPYRESLTRIKEREEARILREALVKIDQKDDEERVHDAAKMEAADLVWRHRNPQLAEVEKTSAYRNPDLDKDKDNRKYGDLGHAKKDPSAPPPDSKSNSRSSSAESTASTDSKRPRLPWLKRRTKVEPPATTPKQIEAPPQENLFQKGVRKFSGRRQTSSGSSKGIFRNPEDEIYEEAEEMPVITESVPAQHLPLSSRASNVLPRGSRPLPEKSYTDPLPDKARPNRVEVWKNAPTQLRNAGYTACRALPQTPIKEQEAENNDSPGYKDGYEIRSDDIRAATSMRKSDRSPNLPTPSAVSDRPGRPIVSFDPRWRPGTESPRNSHDLERPQNKNDSSMAYPVKPKPPVPEITIMEDPRCPALKREREATMQPRSSVPPSIVVPSINVSMDETSEPSQTSRPLPQINFPDDNPPPSAVSTIHIPTIHVEVETEAPSSRKLPVVNVETEKAQSRPLPSINVQPDVARPLPSTNFQHRSRPLPVHTQSSPTKLPLSRPTQSEMASRVPWLSRTPTSSSTSAVTCTACALPISGRIVTASGSSTQTQKARFHPECFTCHHCSTALEAVAFYPEPETARTTRMAAAMPHLEPEDAETQHVVQGNEDLHFFCHLDYHELFSPRCHNCKTPIEGAIVLALGRHYHADHFFCAECGDPFSSESPFVEHNDYPYCVSCHTKRTSARCRMCKQAILNEMTVEALGGKWHEACFVCCDCGGEFGEEGRFFVREVEIDLTEKEKRKGYGPKIEEQAACQSCEERRVKNVNLFL